MAGNGTHRDRIERLERGVDDMQTGMERIERMFEQIMNRDTKKSDSSSSYSGASDSGRSSEDLRAARRRDGDEPPP